MVLDGSSRKQTRTKPENVAIVCWPSISNPCPPSTWHLEKKWSRNCIFELCWATSINWMENHQSVFFSSVVRPVAKAKISIVFDSLLVSLPKYKYSFVYKLWRSFYESSQTATSHFHRIQRSVSSCRPDVLTSCGPVAQTPKPRLKPRTLPFIWFVVLHSLACFPFPLHSIHPMPSPLPFHWLNAVDIDSDFDLDP